MEFDETPRFWCPRVALAAWINFTFSPDENLRSNFRRFKKETKRKNKKNKILSLLFSFSPCPFLTFLFIFSFLSFLLLLLLLFWIHDSYYFIRVRFYPETIYFFSVHFILNELSAIHFLTSEIFVKISSLKSLAAYHPKNRKNFRLSQNLTNFSWSLDFARRI